MIFRRRHENELDEEIRDYIERETHDNVVRGMSPANARHAAMRKFGRPVLNVKEDTRAVWGWIGLERLWQDLRYALRMLRKNPGFTVVAVLTLALGIGVNTTLFTAYNAVALKPLPVSEGASLVRVERWFTSGSQGEGQYAFSYPEYVYYNQHNTVFSALMAASWPVRVLAALPRIAKGESSAFGEAERATAQLVSTDYFADLGVRPIAGRTFLPEEDGPPGAHPVIVLSYPFWRRAFNSDPQIVGRTLQVNNDAFTVVGVTPPDFGGTGIPPQIPDFWAPLSMQTQLIPGQDWLNLPGSYQVQLLGRLRSGTEHRPAQAQIELLTQQFGQNYAAHDKTIAITLQRATLFPNTDDIRFKQLVALFMAVVGMVLLIAGANLANMLLARAMIRHKEISVRIALGAGRGRLIRQLLTESLLLSTLGGSAGLLFSMWGSKLLWLAIAPLLEGVFWSDAPFVIPLGPDVRVFGYTTLLSLVTGVIFGLWPALQFSKPDLTTALKEETGGKLGRSRLRGFLMGGQVAVSMLLLICSGLFVRGLLRAQAADPGFDTRNAFMVFCDLGPDASKAHAIQSQIVDRLENLPETKGVALVKQFPMTGTWTPPVLPERSSESDNGVPSRTLANQVSPSYFDTLGVPILHGRTFTRQEAQTAAQVAIVSESGARRLWPGQNPLGKRFQLDMHFTGKFGAALEVIGVARDVRTANLTRVDPSYVYLPTDSKDFYNILVRTQKNRKDAFASVRSALESVDKNLLRDFSMVSLEEGPVRVQRLMIQTTATFATLLACLALALAAVGIYGVMSYLVSQRTSEIGLRMALGASVGDVLFSIVGRGLRSVLVGAVLGLLGAVGLSTILHATLVFPGSMDLLYGLNMLDPATFIGLPVFVMLVTAVASAVPARRATTVDPMVALRYE
jgi:predicted permease